MTAPKRGVGRKPAPRKKVVKKSASPQAPIPPTFTKDVRGAVVDELPPERRPSARRMKYANVLGEVRENVEAGVWVQIASFVGRHGARMAKHALEAGERPVDGDVEDWEFAARREGEGSVLYARLAE